MLDILTDIIGAPPIGYEFLLYIFGFVLVLFGLYILVQIVSAVLDLFR